MSVIPAALIAAVWSAFTGCVAPSTNDFVDFFLWLFRVRPSLTILEYAEYASRIASENGPIYVVGLVNARGLLVRV